MNSLLVKPPQLIQQLFAKRVWSKPRDENAIYLTFDDGPIPIVTPWVLEILAKYNAKATFFCIGDNIKKHPVLFAEILKNGHAIGNHTQQHSNGWKTSFEAYLADITAVEETMENLELLDQKTKNINLFRPPYGKMTSKQANAVLKKGYKIIMWNVLSMDYDAKISEEKCLKNVLTNLKPGSIIVFHDSLKAEEKLRYILPKILEACTKEGLNCKKLNN